MVLVVVVAAVVVACGCGFCFVPPTLQKAVFDKLLCPEDPQQDYTMLFLVEADANPLQTSNRAGNIVQASETV